MTRREKERMQKKKTKITLENVRQRPRRFQCIVICLVDVGPFCMNVCMSLVHNRAKIDIKSNLNFCPTTISQDFSFTLCVFKGKSFSLFPFGSNTIDKKFYMHKQNVNKNLKFVSIKRENLWF